MYITIEMDDRKRIELDGVKTAEEARAEVEELRETWIWSIVIDGACCQLDERIGYFCVQDDESGAKCYRPDEIVAALYESGLVDCDAEDELAKLFCAVVACEGIRHALSVLCENPRGFANRYEFFDGACCGLDIIDVIFEREYPELADSVDYDGPIWREFDYEFAYGPFEGQEGFGAYFEKKYYDRWSRELTRYDDEGRAL